MATKTLIGGIIVLIIIVLIVIIISTYIILRKRKRAKQQQTNIENPIIKTKPIKIDKKGKGKIPEDVILDFRLAEDMMKDSRGLANPQQILWDIYKYNKDKKFSLNQTTPESIKPIDKPKPDWRRFIRK